MSMVSNPRPGGVGGLVKIGARIISHSRMTVFQMAEVAVPEKLFRSILSRIHRLGRASARAPVLSL
jgi:hypothetical protein